MVVRVQPGARRPGVVGRFGEAWKVAVVAPPDGGRANEELCALVADLAGVRARDVRVRIGGASRTKTLFVAGVAADDLHARFDAACR